MIKFDLAADEQIILVVRKHWIILLGESISLIVASLIPALLLIIGFNFLPHLISVGDPIKLVYLLFFFYMLWLLFLWILFFTAWTEYFLNYWVVTTNRVFTVQQKSLFNREVSSFTLDKIQNLDIDVDGLLATILKFGDITIETAAQGVKFELLTAHHPEYMKSAINEIQNKYHEEPQPVISV